MSTTLTNDYLNNFDDKLKTYSSIFFKTISTKDTLLPEVDTITKPDKNLDIPTGSSTTDYNIDQFHNFIRNIINFKIKISDELKVTNNNMDFITRAVDATFDFNENVRDNIIETLKVINVFVDILEAYKNCIENEGNPFFDSGYKKDINIDQIQLVSDTTRIYHSSSMFPSDTTKNAGYIRNVTISTVPTSILYLSIQSFNMNTYDNVFDKTGTTNDISATIYSSAKTGKTDLTGLVLDGTTDYKRQEYSIATTNPIFNNTSLTIRNRALVTLLLKTLLSLDSAFRKQSVYALYFYYKFVQLYSCLIINVSNVMYANYDNDTIKCINIYNTTMREYVSEIKVKTEGTKYDSLSVDTTMTFVGGTASFSTVAGASKTGSIPNNTVITISTRTEVDPSLASFLASFDNKSSFATLTGVTYTPAITCTGGTPVVFKANYNPIIIPNEGVTNNKNIDRLTTVIGNISKALTVMNDEMSKYSQNNDDNSFEFTSATAATVTLTGTVITGDRVTISITDSSKVSILNKYNYSYDLINDYCVYDNKNKLYYNISEINNLHLDSPPSFEIKINAVLVKTDLAHDASAVLFLNNDGNVVSSGTTITNSTGKFLDIRKKDINAFKDEYDKNKNKIYNLNSEIGLNTNKVQRQKNLYDNQYNKNVFLTRQILIYNIIISIIVLILIFINLMKLDKQLAKTISLGCFGAIILLFVIYITSNITYIETFNGSDTDTTSILHSLTKTYYDKSSLNSNTYNANKIKVLNIEINNLNKQFISYFEKIIITIPSADSVDFYREIKDNSNSEIDNKNYISKLLKFNNSQGNNNMDAIKYEIENNKL